jgi:hypothetical protein
MAMHALCYNDPSGNVKSTNGAPPLLLGADLTFRHFRSASGFERRQITVIVRWSASRAGSLNISFAPPMVLARRVHYSTLDHAGVVAVIIL